MMFSSFFKIIEVCIHRDVIFVGSLIYLSEVFSIVLDHKVIQFENKQSEMFVKNIE